MPRAKKREWFDDDSYWRDLYPVMFSAKRLIAVGRKPAVSRRAGDRG